MTFIHRVVAGILTCLHRPNPGGLLKVFGYRFILLLCSLSSMGYSSPNTYLNINLPRTTGMFSTFGYVAGVLYHYDRLQYAGVEINFGNDGLYYDQAYGPNWWQYYCKPIQLGDNTNKVMKYYNAEEFRVYALFLERHVNRHQVNELIQKYIKINEHIQTKIEQFTADNFAGHHIISVHYRGTDKSKEAPRVPYLKVVQTIRRHIYSNNLQNYKIFLATDEARFAQFLNRVFPGLVVMNATLLSKGTVPIHFRSGNKYLQGEEAIIDCILLSKGDILIRTSSNLSLWSTFFNPAIPVIELSKRKNNKPVRSHLLPIIGG